MVSNCKKKYRKTHVHGKIYLMKILEVRDGFIKFEADESISLSSFIVVSGLEKNYIAQIIQIKRSGINPIAIAKILFLYDGTLQAYDKTLPPEDAAIKDFTSDILLNSIRAENPIIAGEMHKKNLNIVVDASAFDKKMLMSIDDKDENNIIVRNLSKQFNNLNKRVVIIDTLGIINAKKFTAGIDFKLPLDTASLAFMYQDCLNDATSDSKSLIIEIFKDLAEYSSTVPFVPFEALKNIVDDMVDKSHVFKLLVLKNKLAKFHKLGYFAKNELEADKIEKILEQKCSIIDLSKLDSNFQNRYLAFLYEKMLNKNNIQVFLELSNTTSKKNLKNILEGAIPTAFITHSKFKYLNDIKNLFDNFIISPSFTNNEIFRVYNTFLNAIPTGTYLIAGEAVNYIPLISSSKIIDEVVHLPQSQEEHLTEETKQKNEEIDNNIEDTKIEELENSTVELNDKNENEDIVQNTLSEVEESVQEEKLNEECAVNTEKPVEKIDIVEPELVDNEEEEEEFSGENFSSNKLSKEEIIANIQEKSEIVISSVAQDLKQPVGDMFESDKIEDENIESEVSEELEVSEDLSESDLELNDQLFNEQNDDFSQSNEIIEEIDLEQNAENDVVKEPAIEITEPFEQILMEDDSNEQRYSSVEEISLEDSFDNEMEYTEEITDYVSQKESPLLEEDLETNDELNFEKNVSEEDVLSSEYMEMSSEESSEVVIPEDLDFDIESPEDQQVVNIEENSQNQTIQEDSDVLPISNDTNEDFEEIVELDPEETNDNDIIIDITDEDFPEEKQSEEEIDKQIVKDVDKVFTTRKDDDISDSDLDFIDELNSDDSILDEVSDGDLLLEDATSDDENYGILENDSDTVPLDENKNDDILETRNSSTPIVPVYDAEIPQEDMVESDPIQQGDNVVHAKYGNGVVEKMIKYGNKTLFSINFDNIGRRLLDPTLTEIKKA